MLISRLEDVYLYKQVFRCAKEIAGHEKGILFEKYRSPQIVDRFKFNRWEVNVINYLRGFLTLDEFDLNKFNAAEYLRIVKIVEQVLKQQPIKTTQSSYPLRKKILQLASPHMTSTQAYTVSLEPEHLGSLDYLCNPENWIAEQVGHQAKAVASLFIQMVGLSEVVKGPIFYAIRGNTGAGKTSYLQKIFNRESGFLSLDPLKAFLKRNVKLTNVQVYEEANALFANYLNGIFKQKALRFIFDSRLLSVDYIQKHVIDQAEIRGEEVALIEIDVPLSTSLVRSLTRDPYGSEACAPVDAVVHGYKLIRQERRALLSLVQENPRITSYKLYSGAELVAEKQGGCLHIYCQEKYQECLRVPAQEEIEGCLNQVIDAAYIEQAPEALQRWQGKTVQAALNAHAFQIEEVERFIPVDEERFEVPSDDLLIAKYGDFYKKMAMKHIVQEVSRETRKWKIAPDGKTLYVEYVEKRELNICDRLRINIAGCKKEELIGDYAPEPVFAAVPILVRNEENLDIISISTRIELSSRNMHWTNFVEYAKEHENPVRFLLDHYNFWEYQQVEIVKFLGDYTSFYGVLDIFEKIQEKSNVQLAKALHKPALKARAADLLFQYGGFAELAPFLHEENIRRRFEEIVESDPDYLRRVAALEQLESVDLKELNSQICRALLLPVLDDYQAAEEIAWMMRDYAYPVVASQTGRLCEALLKDRSYAVYSLLKLIGVKTPDRKEFDKVVDTLSIFNHSLGNYSELFKKDDFVPVSPKEMQKSNPHFCLELPERTSSAIKGNKLEAMFRLWKKYNAHLEAAIYNPALPEEMRIGALRKCAITLFKDVDEFYGNLEKREIAKTAISRLLSDEATPKKLAREAGRFKEWSQA